MVAIYKVTILYILISVINTVTSFTLQQQPTEDHNELGISTDINSYDYPAGLPELPFLLANLSEYNCDDQICVVKCCPEGSFFHTDTFECVEVSQYNISDWKPRLPRNNKDVVVIYGLPPVIIELQRLDNFTCSPYNENEYSLKEDGRILFYSLQEILTQKSYCIDNMHQEGKIKVSAMICHKEVQKSQYIVITDKFHVAAVAISCFFLFLVILFFAVSPQYLDLQKKCTLSSCVNLFLGFLLLLINNTPAVISGSEDACLALAFLTQFFFLTFYFWLNVTCFEISRIIRGTFNLHSISDLTRSSSRFLFYCGYSYGFPLIICCITVTMQLIPIRSFPEGIRSYIIKPHINEGRCWLREGMSEFVYYYVIEIFLHVINAIFMGYTAYLLHREKLFFFCCKRGDSTPLRTHALTNYLDAFKEQLRIYIMYLFIWIMNTVTLINKRAYAWRIIDIIVALQGLFLFLFIIQTNKNFLVLSFYEKLSNTAKELSNRIGELTSSSHCSLTESSEFYLKPSYGSNNCSKE